MNIVTSFFVVRRLPQAFSLSGEGVALPPALQSTSSTAVDAALNAMPNHVRHRQQEYEQCVERNLKHPSVKRLLLLCQDELSWSLAKQRIDTWTGGNPALRRKLVPTLFHRAPLQPTYADLFRASRLLVDPSTPTMVCNSDIYLGAPKTKSTDFDLDRVRALLLLENRAAGRNATHSPPPADGTGGVAHKKRVLALTRYESEVTLEAPLIDDYRGSHDAFVFLPRDLPEGFLQAVDHPQNCYKSENIVIRELQQHGFDVRNPCRSVRIFHQHEADVRQWLPPVDEERYGRADPEH